jgi:hypothetical protein
MPGDKERRGDRKASAAMAVRTMGRPALAAQSLHQQSSKGLHKGLDMCARAVEEENAV